VFYREFTEWYFTVNFLEARAQASCNLVFFLQLCLAHKDKLSKDSGSDSESHTWSRNSTEGD